MSWNGSKALVTFCRKIRDYQNKYAIIAICQILKAVLTEQSRGGKCYVWYICLV